MKKNKVFLDWKRDCALTCPTCRGINLHHENVYIVNRKRESHEECSIIDIDCLYESKPIIVKRKIENNKNRERNWIEILYSCENGCVKSTMAIYQHKGTTFFEWLNEIIT